MEHFRHTAVNVISYSDWLTYRATHALWKCVSGVTKIILVVYGSHPYLGKTESGVVIEMFRAVTGGGG